MQLRTIQRFEDEEGNVIQEWEQVVKIHEAHTHTGGAFRHPPGVSPGHSDFSPSPASPLSAAAPVSEPPPASAGSAVAPLAWRRWFEQVVDEGELWEGYQGLTPEQVLSMRDVKKAIVVLDLVQLRDPLNFVLRFGAPRCLQVREWVETRRQTEGVINPAGLIRRTLERHPRRSNIDKVERRKLG